HDKTHFEARKQMMRDLVSDICSQFERDCISIEIKDQYFNMREKVEPVMHIVDLAQKAMEEVNVKPIIKPIRGGTDGAQLSFMGLPCPNIFAGGHNFHGKYEYVPVESMQKATEVIIKLAELTAKKYE
ncbi:MAG TPA: M20/M25/M40 family metallo-hydrolase, partial [Gillisia sp.]|nr:M20/M25/M40 family metallo-hydrolase [Gillisia sp.]